MQVRTKEAFPTHLLPHSECSVWTTNWFCSPLAILHNRGWQWQTQKVECNRRYLDSRPASVISRRHSFPRL
jgi:hypothetical protein